MFTCVLALTLLAPTSRCATGCRARHSHRADRPALRGRPAGAARCWSPWLGAARPRPRPRPGPLVWRTWTTTDYQARLEEFRAAHSPKLTRTTLEAALADFRPRRGASRATCLYRYDASDRPPLRRPARLRA